MQDLGMVESRQRHENIQRSKAFFWHICIALVVGCMLFVVCCRLHVVSCMLGILCYGLAFAGCR